MVKATELGGGAWHSQEFTSSGTFTVPAGVHRVLVTGCAGGNGGDGDNGGMGGTACYQKPLSTTPGSTLTLTIGAGGAGVSGSTSASSANAGNTIIGPLVLPASDQAFRLSNVAGAQEAGAFVLTGAQPGGYCGLYKGGKNGTGAASSQYGGAAGLFGPGPSRVNTSATPGTNAAPNSGAGGSGGYGAAGGNGGSGRIILEWFA